VNDSLLIAQQARKIAELKETVTRLKEAIDSVRNNLYCIGGPLNDNKLGYTKEQLAPFFRIANLTEEWS
jgi:hypothetical protein